MKKKQNVVILMNYLLKIAQQNDTRSHVIKIKQNKIRLRYQFDVKQMWK